MHERCSLALWQARNLPIDGVAASAVECALRLTVEAFDAASAKAAAAVLFALDVRRNRIMVRELA